MMKPSVLPAAKTVQRGIGEVWCGTALVSDEFTPSTNVVNHPGGRPEVVRISSNLAFVEGQRSQQVSEIPRAGLDHEVWRVHRSPELGFKHGA